MPITTAQIEVGIERVLLHQTDADGCFITVHSDAGGGTDTYLGNSTVTAANGYELDGQTTIQFHMPPTSSLHAITSSGTHTLSIMVTN
jgi:hypothetical protein